MTSGASATNAAKLRRLSERAMHRAEESLQALLGSSVRLTVSGTRVCPSSALSILGREEGGAPAIGLQFRITGQADGRILILLPLSMVGRFLQLLLGGPASARPLSELELSAIQEVGNIMASSFLSELGDELGRELLHSAPEIRLENIAPFVREVVASLRALGSKVLVVRGVLEEGEQPTRGRFFVVPEVAALEPIPCGAARKREGVP